MDNIVEPNSNFDFSKLSLAQPTSIQGGAYFTKILFDGTPLYIQTPKSSTRQGFLKNGKKIQCELMFENNDEEFIHWMECLETNCQRLIFEKSTDWFQSSLELADIETAFNSPIKIFKSGKFYLVRTNVKINSLTNNALVKIYNENEIPLTMNDVTSESSIISILEIQGIKFTSRNFQIEIDLKQVMLLNNDIIFENCLIKKSTTTPLATPTTNIKQTMDNEEVVSEQETILQDRTTTSTGSTILDVIDEDTDKNLTELDLGLIDADAVADTTIALDCKNDNNTDTDTDTDTNTTVPSDLSTLEVNVKEDDCLMVEDMKEIDFDAPLESNGVESLKLKKPMEVYYEMYKEVRQKAKTAKKEALLAFLEAKNIKQTYMLDDMDSSSDEGGFYEGE